MLRTALLLATLLALMSGAARADWVPPSGRCLLRTGQLTECSDGTAHRHIGATLPYRDLRGTIVAGAPACFEATAPLCEWSLEMYGPQLIRDTSGFRSLEECLSASRGTVAHLHLTYECRGQLVEKLTGPVPIPRERPDTCEYDARHRLLLSEETRSRLPDRCIEGLAGDYPTRAASWAAEIGRELKTKRVDAPAPTGLTCWISPGNAGTRIFSGCVSDPPPRPPPIAKGVGDACANGETVVECPAPATNVMATPPRRTAEGIAAAPKQAPEYGTAFGFVPDDGKARPLNELISNCYRRSSLPGIPETASLGPGQSPQRSASSDPPANRTRILSRESKQAMRFYTGWVKRCGASQARRRSLSAVDRIATTLLQRRD